VSYIAELLVASVAQSTADAAAGEGAHAVHHISVAAVKGIRTLFLVLYEAFIHFQTNPPP
jgi:hypothetical protein